MFELSIGRINSPGHRCNLQLKYTCVIPHPRRTAAEGQTLHGSSGHRFSPRGDRRAPGFPETRTMRI
eukprot:3790872-Prymnesium_polylepis.1